MGKLSEARRIMPDDLMDQIEDAIGPTLIRRVAEMIDPAAFSVWYSGTDPGAKPVPPDVRRRYAQSQAILLATNILKLASTYKQKELQEALIRHEAEGWRIIGIPIDRPELMETIRRKITDSGRRALQEDKNG